MRAFQAEARRRQRCRYRALQRRAESAVQHAVPGERWLSAPAPPASNFQILDPNNQPIPCPPGTGNTCAPFPTAPSTAPDQRPTIGSLAPGHQRRQAFRPRQLFHLRHQHRPQHGQLPAPAASSAIIYPDLFVGPNPAIPAPAQIIHTAGNFGFSPVDLERAATPITAFMSPIRSTSRRGCRSRPALRLNLAKVNMADHLGTSPDLNGNYTFSRFNPVVGLTYKILPGCDVYTGYSEANRAPTPLELGCSNPRKPCLLEGFLVSDPPLQQVVARTNETGLRGDMPARRRPVRLEARRCSAPTARTTSSMSRASFRAVACSRTLPRPAARASKRAAVPRRAMARLRQLCLHRCHLSVHRHDCVAQQPVGECERKYLRHARQADSRHPAASVQGRPRLCGHAGSGRSAAT